MGLFYLALRAKNDVMLHYEKSAWKRIVSSSLSLHFTPKYLIAKGRGPLLGIHTFQKDSFLLNKWANNMHHHFLSNFFRKVSAEFYSFQHRCTLGKEKEAKATLIHMRFFTFCVSSFISRSKHVFPCWNQQRESHRFIL